MLNRTWTLYIHKNKINGKVYIGITCQKPEKRWANGKHYEGCSHFNNAIQKYGWDNFEHIILKNDIQTEEEAIKLEKETIEKYKSLDSDFGYNMVEGGKGYHSGYRMSPTHKANMMKSIQAFKESERYEKYIEKLKHRLKNLSPEQREEMKKKSRETRLNKKLENLQQPLCLISTHKRLKFLYIKKVFRNFYDVLEYDSTANIENILKIAKRANKLLGKNKKYDEIYDEKKNNWLFLKDACIVFEGLNPVVKIDASQNTICKIYRNINDINKSQRERILNLITSQDICQKIYTWNYYLQWCANDI